MTETLQKFKMTFKTVAQDGIEEGTVIEGFASTPNPDRHEDIVNPEALAKALDGYMKNPIVLFQHNQESPVGRVMSARIADGGLFIRALIVDEPVERKIRAGILKAFSIGFWAEDFEFRNKETGEVKTLSEYNALGYTDKLDYWKVIKSLELGEISIVSVPSNRESLFSLVKSVEDLMHKTITLENMDKKEEALPVEEVVEAAPEVVEEEPVAELPVEEEVVEEEVVEEAAEEAAEEEEPVEPTEPEPVKEADGEAPSEEPSVDEAGQDAEEKSADFSLKDLEVALTKAVRMYQKATERNEMLEKRVGELESIIDKKPQLKGLMYGLSPEAAVTEEKKDSSPLAKSGDPLLGMLDEAFVKAKNETIY